MNVSVPEGPVNRHDAFRARIVALMEEFGVKLIEEDHYDGEEAFCGTSYAFVGEGICLEVSELPSERP